MAVGGGYDVLEGEMAFAFFGLEIAGGEQAAEPTVGRSVGRIGQHLEAVDGNKPHADDELDIVLSRFVVSAHYAGKRIAIGNADGEQIKGCGGGDHLVRMRGAAQERKVRGDSEFGVDAHEFSRQSRKQPVHEPVRLLSLAAKKPFAKQPEAMTV